MTEAQQGRPTTIRLNHCGKGGRPPGAMANACPGAGKTCFPRARKDLARGTVWCPECGRPLEIHRWPGGGMGIPSHQRLRAGAYVGRHGTLPDKGNQKKNIQPDKGPPICPCGGKLHPDTDSLGRTIIACAECGRVET